MLKMDQSNQKLHDRNFLIDQHSPWQVSEQSNSMQNIVNTTRDFQKSYQLLKQSTELDSQFMQDVYSSLVIVNDQLIPNTNRTEMIAKFKKCLPNVNAQKFVSTYANEKFLNRSYLQLISEHPEIQNYQLKNSRNIYTVHTFKDGSIKLVATNLSDMHAKNSNYVQKYKSLGIRATVIMLKNEFPIIKYSYFMQ
ncbi:MAG: hypothetical protein ICW73_02035 [Buchnera aphidicola (Pentalonia nigronervosa)]|uniref:Uncharacterized protein n=1 Tax=Buchnera aphidicola (Pentalonia nigronervosa) TaxID=1309793 RepID=A0A7H1B054_9GAMM|nr:MAG: hypothetical protein ICW73_02035 [Buchnera aphidicola (Pentalonia nigronervosa)]